MRNIASGRRAPCTVIFEATAPGSSRSAGVGSIATASIFSSRRCSFVVPGIGTSHGFWAKSRAMPIFRAIPPPLRAGLVYFIRKPIGPESRATRKLSFVRKSLMRSARKVQLPKTGRVSRDTCQRSSPERPLIPIASALPEGQGIIVASEMSATADSVKTTDSDCLILFLPSEFLSPKGDFSAQTATRP